MSLNSKHVSGRQHIIGSCFFIHSSNLLCLLIVVFNLFEFNVISKKVGFMSAILLFVFYISRLFCPSVPPLLLSFELSGLFSSLPF